MRGLRTPHAYGALLFFAAGVVNGVTYRIDALEQLTPQQEAVANILLTLIEAYEERYALNRATPLSVLQHLMEANDVKQKTSHPFSAAKA